MASANADLSLSAASIRSSACRDLSGTNARARTRTRSHTA
jgi:hypothetical protein